MNLLHYRTISHKDRFKHTVFLSQAYLARRGRLHIYLLSFHQVTEGWYGPVSWFNRGLGTHHSWPSSGLGTHHGT